MFEFFVKPHKVLFIFVYLNFLRLVEVLYRLMQAAGLGRWHVSELALELCGCSCYGAKPVLVIFNLRLIFNGKLLQVNNLKRKVLWVLEDLPPDVLQRCGRGTRLCHWMLLVWLFWSRFFLWQITCVRLWLVKLQLLLALQLLD